MKNFDFLKDIPAFKKLHQFCDTAEINQISDPFKSISHCRLALEHIVKVIYYLKDIPQPVESNLFNLVSGEEFKSFVNDYQLMKALHYIRKEGNKTLHDGGANKSISFFCVINLYSFVGAVLEKLGVIESYPNFNRDFLSSVPSVHIEPPSDTEPEEEKTIQFKGKLPQNETLNFKKPKYFTEAETRRFYIDQQLREAGWDVLEIENSIVPTKAGIEIRVEGMPNNKEEGFADYVLFGRDGKPLAVVEAKKTSVDPIKGKHQATLYAECLENQFGVKPVIYYTNGYETYIVDGLGYPSRRLYGFHTISDLELLVQRQNRGTISDYRVNQDITNRLYQKTAITSVCEHFNKKYRRALLVMATGTGKTRVSISLVELLMRNGWVKNVLFLADRTALVSQAKKNFTKLLPHVPVSVLSDNGSKPDLNSRLTFSTYQTMINYVDGDTKDFSIGRFDLIIIDEAHRSIFGKYSAIFDYFDSLIVGLTATPRSDVDKSTYQMFLLEDGFPNYHYELEEAVADNYLVPYRGIIRHSQHIKVGIKYKDLSQDEKEQLEKVWEYESAKKSLDLPETKRDIRGNEVFTYIFNEDTIDKVLHDLMKNGLKVQSGEQIGKTIIFAYNHEHAELIVKRFNTIYPEYGAEFCVLIDNYVTYAHNLIERFEVRDKNPQIAVSVDMLDTGIDVPDVLNLVFFKIVRSKIKFLQMIGRGTRLSTDIFGVGEDKKEFLIFDYCENFEYFEKNPNGIEAKPIQSLTEKLFNIRLDIAHELQSLHYQEDEFYKSYHDELKEILNKQVKNLNQQRIDVRKNLIVVDKYRLASTWQYISPLDILEVKKQISPLITPVQEDENAKKFDLLVLSVEMSLIDKDVTAKLSMDKIVDIAKLLSDKTTIPQVNLKISIIKEILTENFWKNLSVDNLERIRLEIRELMRFLVGEKGQTFTVDIEDEIVDGGEATGIPKITTYKQKVLEYLEENLTTNPTLQKILNIEHLERTDILELERILWTELGSKDDYDKYVQNKFAGGNVATFIRSIIGVNRMVAVDKFNQFLAGQELNSQQQEYVKTIITYVCENGDITRDILANETPFDGYDWMRVFGDYVGVIPRYVDVIHEAVIA